ncbi:MAG: Na(+)-translocating NADH-quinone reductase subunit A [Bacteroidales bacterium]
MSKVIRIKKGLNIKLLGEAEKTVSSMSSEYYAIKPLDFIGLFPKMMVQVGDQVKAGSPLLFDKYREDIVITSPVSGTVHDIRRGAKRILLEVIIKADGKDSYEDFGAVDPNQLKAEEIKEKMLKSGVWSLLRQRPYSVVANPSVMPKAIVISGFDSSPLAPDYDLIVQGQKEVFQTGVNALKKLTQGKLYLNLSNQGCQADSFTQVQGVETYRFEGPHPAGNLSVQLNKIDPINKGEYVWYLNAQAVIIIGKLFQKGVYDAETMIALTGSEVLKPKYFRAKIGVSIQSMIENNVTEIKKRYISGNVLTGKQIEKDSFVNFYHNQVTVIPEGDYFEFLGWALPGLEKFSFSKTFFSYLNPSKKYRLDSNLHGGRRAFVMTGQYEKVFPLNIYPMQLLKAILVKDIDLMENLGIYEVDEEDFALCEFIDTSKTEMQELVREGLDLMRKEMS